MSTSLTRIRDTNEYMTAVSVQARIGACLSVFVKKNSPTGGIGRSAGIVDPESGIKQSSIAPGMINYLQPGEDAQFLNPSGQAQNAKDYLNYMQRITGAGQGLSYEASSRDMSQVNYSSARQGLLEDKRTYQEMQDYLIEHFLYEIYNEFLVISILDGKLPIKDFFNNKQKYLRHKFITSGWDWIDPKKEADANETALSSGQTTLAEVTANKGGDWKDNLEQRAKELNYAKQLGIDLQGGEKKVEQITEE
jgi:lambda family phage portal protein